MGPGGPPDREASRYGSAILWIASEAGSEANPAVPQFRLPLGGRSTARGVRRMRVPRTAGAGERLAVGQPPGEIMKGALRALPRADW